jgi:DNA-binding transcriptional LysR family regulator
VALNLDDIDYFLAVARHGQVRAAALESGVSQPAVTKGIQRLEKELGFPLFTRSRRGMALTPVAERFHERTRDLRAGLADAAKEASDLHLGSLGVLRVGVSPLYAQRLFVPACLQLNAQRPAARVLVNINLNEALLLALRRGDLDLSLNALPAMMPTDLRATPLIRDDLCLVVRAGHPLLSKRRLRLHDLENAHWMLPSPGVAARRSVEGRLSEAGLPPPRVAVEVNNTAAPLAALIEHSDLISIMSESMLDSQGEGSVRALPLLEARFSREVGVLTRREAALSPLAHRFIEILERTSRKDLGL